MVAKIKDKTAGVSIEEFVGLKPRYIRIWQMIIVSIKRQRGINKNVVATIRQNVYKDVFLNKKCLRHSMNRIQIKDHRIGTYEINKIKKKKNDFFVLL